MEHILWHSVFGRTFLATLYNASFKQQIADFKLCSAQTCAPRLCQIANPPMGRSEALNSQSTFKLYQEEIEICPSECLESATVREMAQKEAVTDTFPLGELPFAMLMTVLSQTSPRDVAVLAAVSRSFAAAAGSDFVWRKFLPADVEEIVNNAHGGPLAYDSFKGLYDRLAQYVLLGDGNEGYWIDPKSGRVHRSYSSRTLHIVWGDTERYWRWMHQEGSRFNEVAFLNDVCWLELSGEINTRLPPGTYTISWTLKFEREAAYGWDAPVVFTFSHGIQDHSTEVKWNFRNRTEQNEDLFRWSDYGMGRFTVERGDDATSIGNVNLTFGMRGSSGAWKRGMFVDGVVISPVTHADK